MNESNNRTKQADKIVVPQKHLRYFASCTLLLVLVDSAKICLLQVQLLIDLYHRTEELRQYIFPGVGVGDIDNDR